MTTRNIITWLSSCPVLSGAALNPDYLPSYAGWSLSTVRETARRDILGETRSVREIRITRRSTVRDGAERLRLLEELEDLAEWARENPPETCRIRVSALPQFSSRNASGTEDLSVTLTLTDI